MQSENQAQLCNYRLAERKNGLSRGRTRNRQRKKTKGRKRHIVVDTMGDLLAVVVHAANIHDTKSGIPAAKEAFEKYPSIQRFCADAGYRKTFEQDVSQEPGLGVDIVARTTSGWAVLPKGWIVERSLAWLNNSRRLSKDYEVSVRSAHAVCIITAFNTLLKRFYPIGTASQFSFLTCCDAMYKSSPSVLLKPRVEYCLYLWYALLKLDRKTSFVKGNFTIFVGL